MKFFVDEDIPRSAVKILRDAGFEAIDIRETPLRGAKDWQIAAHVKKEGYCLVTGDYDFADIRSYPPIEYVGIVVINAGKDATAAMIADLTREFISQSQIIKRLTGKLAIVEPDVYGFVAILMNNQEPKFMQDLHKIRERLGRRYRLMSKNSFYKNSQSSH